MQTAAGKMIIGVLALQGDFAEHINMLDGIEVESREVRLADQLDELDGLIIPGGESTTVGKLAQDFELIEPLREFGRQRSIWGTCAGEIFLAKNVHSKQPLLELMDITIARNAFGRQADSFETKLNIPALQVVDSQNKPFHAVFIRAPLIESVEGTAQSIATLPDGRIVAAQQGRLLATSFHPELTDDDRFHRYFLSVVSGEAL